MSEDTQELDLMEMTLDDLEDLPTNDPYPAGVHRVKMTLEEKSINNTQSVEASFEYIETVELSGDVAEKDLPKAGDKTSVLCMLNNEWGRGNLKLLATPVGAALGVSSIRDAISQCNEMEVVIVTFLSLDKKNEVMRMKVKELEVV